MKIPVPYGLNVSVEIIRDVKNDNAQVNVHAPMYIKKFWTLPHSYKSSVFSDYEIILDRDFQTVMSKHFPSS